MVFTQVAISTFFWQKTRFAVRAKSAKHFLARKSVTQIRWTAVSQICNLVWLFAQKKSINIWIFTVYFMYFWSTSRVCLLKKIQCKKAQSDGSWKMCLGPKRVDTKKVVITEYNRGKMLWYSWTQGWGVFEYMTLIKPFRFNISYFLNPHHLKKYSINESTYILHLEILCCFKLI